MATSAKNWKSTKSIELTLPSENVALVRPPSPDLLLRKGVLPDSMASMVSDLINSGKGMSKKAAADLAAQPGMVDTMMDTMDRVLVAVVLEPHVLYHKGVKGENGVWREPRRGEDAVEIPEADRDPEALYADEVDFEDKSFIFNYVMGGTRDVAKFRLESSLPVGDLQDGQDDEGPTVISAGDH